MPRISSFLSYLGSLNIIADFTNPRKRVESIEIYYTHFNCFQNMKQMVDQISLRML